MSEAAIEVSGIVHGYTQGPVRLEVLRGVSLAVAPGEIVALVGPSGSGKSTLLHIAGLLERPSSGEVVIAGTGCSHLSDDRRTALRRSRLGFVYQFHHLLPEFTALENVVLPQMIAGKPRGQAGDKARELLALMGLALRLSHRPAELSGGEQQRVAIARAMANDPMVLLADEPTGNLDHATAEAVFGEIVGLVRKTGIAALVATHNLELAARMDRTVRLSDGLLEAA
ncbi:MAG: ABC transporter ATP-binding protein [Alphaproteobacteria bacterium]